MVIGVLSDYAKNCRQYDLCALCLYVVKSHDRKSFLRSENTSTSNKSPSCLCIFFVSRLRSVDAWSACIPFTAVVLSYTAEDIEKVRRRCKTGIKRKQSGYKAMNVCLSNNFVCFVTGIWNGPGKRKTPVSPKSYLRSRYVIRSNKTNAVLFATTVVRKQKGMTGRSSLYSLYCLLTAGKRSAGSFRNPPFSRPFPRGSSPAFVRQRVSLRHPARR
jgi:hypothetical protein